MEAGIVENSSLGESVRSWIGQTGIGPNAIAKLLKKVLRRLEKSGGLQNGGVAGKWAEREKPMAIRVGGEGEGERLRLEGRHVSTAEAKKRVRVRVVDVGQERGVGVEV